MLKRGRIESALITAKKDKKFSAEKFKNEVVDKILKEASVDAMDKLANRLTTNKPTLVPQTMKLVCTFMVYIFNLDGKCLRNLRKSKISIAWSTTGSTISTVACLWRKPMMAVSGNPG